MLEIIWWDAGLGEHVGLDSLGREHYGLSFGDCVDRVREANRVITDDMAKQPCLYTNCERPTIDECADRYSDLGHRTECIERPEWADMPLDADR